MVSTPGCVLGPSFRGADGRPQGLAGRDVSPLLTVTPNRVASRVLFTTVAHHGLRFSHTYSWR